MVLEVTNGLANRLLALVSGICLAEDLNLRLVVYWSPQNAKCGAKFSELFLPGSLPYPTKVIDGMPHGPEVLCLTQEKAVEAVLRGYTIKSYIRFHRSDPIRWRNHLQRLLPINSILHKVRENFRILPENFVPIGVHIRRTDNQKSISESPISAFETAMQKIPNGYFFVATDDSRAVQHLENTFPGRVHCHETLRERNSVEGMQEAVVSLYTLALCTRIFGSFGSTFSEMAARLRLTEFETIRK